MSQPVFVRIRNPDIWQKFKEYVVTKHGKLNGALGEELCRAIALYLQMQETHTHRNQYISVDQDDEISAIEREILEEVQPGGLVPKEMLATIIARVSGVADDRSIRSRVRRLMARGVIRPDFSISPRGNVFRVVGLEADDPG